MDKVTAVRKRLNREQWKSLISECRSSGMTVSRWCKENNICEQMYYKNLKKLREEMIESLTSPLPVANEPLLHLGNRSSNQPYRIQKHPF